MSSQSVIYGAKDNHVWVRGNTEQVGDRSEYKSTHYHCKHCGVVFNHQYGLHPDIVKALKLENIPKECGITHIKTKIIDPQNVVILNNINIMPTFTFFHRQLENPNGYEYLICQDGGIKLLLHMHIRELSEIDESNYAITDVTNADISPQLEKLDFTENLITSFDYFKRGLTDPNYFLYSDKRNFTCGVKKEIALKVMNDAIAFIYNTVHADEINWLAAQRE